MGTVTQTLDVARSQLGVKESPSGSNIVLYNDWYWGKGKYGSWAAWCLVFILWVCAKSGVNLPARTASCGEFMNAAKKAGMWVTSNFQEGDLVIFDWSGKKTITSHIGIVEHILPDYGVQSIEGNTSTSDNSNGGEVMRRQRAMKYIVGAVRPVYDKEIDKEDVSNMTIQEFLNQITDEQAYTLVTKAQKYAATLPEPSWSQNEGHWANAQSKGIINGGSPEGLIKRDEFVAVMGRCGLLDR